MTITVAHRSRHMLCPEAERHAGIVARSHGLAACAIFFAAFVYGIGFVSNLVVPKGIDSGTIWPPFVAFCIDLELLCLLAVQHGGITRRGFKRMVAAYVSPEVARSTYVLFTGLMLILLFALWQPLPAIVWKVADPVAAAAIRSLSFSVG